MITHPLVTMEINSSTENANVLPFWPTNGSNLTTGPPGEGEGPKYYTDPFEVRFQNILDILEIYVVPIIILIGLIGNTISILVFFRNPLRKTSSSIYLASLAICDNGFLVMLIFQWLVWFDVQLYHLNGPCQLFTYITNVCAFLSVWYVVGFTVERYIAVFYPLKRQTWCTPTRSKIVVASMAAVSVLGNNFHLWTSHSQQMYGVPVCVPKTEYIGLLTRLNNLDTVVTFLVPFAAIFFMNARIMMRITQMYRLRSTSKETTNGNNPHSQCLTLHTPNEDTSVMGGSSSLGAPRSSNPETTEGYNNHSNCLPAPTSCSSPFRAGRNPSLSSSRFQSTLRFSGPDKRHSHQLKITRLLLVVSTTFLVLNLPSHAFRVYGFVMMLIKGAPTSSSNEIILWQQVCQILYYCNFSINIFLYSFCGKSFRQAFWKAFGRFWCRSNRKESKYCQSYLSKKWRSRSRSRSGITTECTPVTRMQMVDMSCGEAPQGRNGLTARL